MREYLLTLLVAAAVTYLLTPVARRIALRWGAMTAVRDRDVHAIPTPRLGGIAMFGRLRAPACWSRASCRSSGPRARRRPATRGAAVRRAC